MLITYRPAFVRGAAQPDAFGVDYSEVIVTNLMSGSALSGVDQHRDLPALGFECACDPWLVDFVKAGWRSIRLSQYGAYRLRSHSRRLGVSVAGGLGKRDHPPSRFLVLAVHAAPYAAVATSCEARG